MVYDMVLLVTVAADLTHEIKAKRHLVHQYLDIKWYQRRSSWKKIKKKNLKIEKSSHVEG